jgi:Flp pilus assembly protein TadD
MSNRYPIRVVLLFVLALQASQCLLAERTGSIAGSVMTLRGEVSDHPIRVTLESHGNAIATAFSDNDGKFSFLSLPPGIYRIEVNDEKYRPIDESVDVDPLISAPTFVRLNLVPKDSAGTENPAPGRNPNMAGSAELKQYPKPALKEFEKGVKAGKNGSPDEAIGHYQKAVKLAPDFYVARNNLGSAYLGKSQFAAAQEQFEEVIKLNPSDGAAYFNMGNLFLLTQKYEDAAHSLDQGLSREPDSTAGHFLLGSLLAQTGKASQAEKELRTSLQLDPKTSKAHLVLVNLFLQQRRQTEAVNELKQFLKDTPDDPYSPKVQEVLKKLEAQLAAKAQNP